MQHRVSQIVTAARAGVSAAYWNFLRKMKAGEGCYFPSPMIHPSAPWIRENWSRLNRGVEDEDWRKDAILRVSGHTMVTFDGALSLLDQVRFCEANGIEGDYVELGTWKGGCLALMALANLRYGSSRRNIRGFDSFRGMPEADPERDNDANVVELPPGALAASKGDVLQVLERTGYPREKVDLHEGWFRDTVPRAEIDRIAILRIDGDFYEAYKLGLDHLFDRVSPGGFVIFDDWVFAGCRQAVSEFFERHKTKPYICYADATVRYVQVP